MKYLFLNLKRFDLPIEMGGVNRLAPIHQWADAIVGQTQQGLENYDPQTTTFVQFFPEAHLLLAQQAKTDNSKIQLGCQAVCPEDIAVNGNFGALTTMRPAAAAKAMGCDWVLIGHCEERREKASLLALAGCDCTDAINVALNKEILAAQARGLKILYCIGETAEQQECWQQVLQNQIQVGLKDVDKSQVVIAYEPIWSIGPGKQPASREYIQKVATFIKSIFPQIAVVYGGGLKQDNAEMLASIPEIDGGLIALTRFVGEIGFYPQEYLEIIRLYLEAGGNKK